MRAGGWPGRLHNRYGEGQGISQIRTTPLRCNILSCSS
jgi:hypothetical protein